MPFTPNTYSDYAIERDIRYIEQQREWAEEAMIDAVLELECDEGDLEL